MLIHVDDHSNPKFPEGWAPITEPLFEGEAVAWILAEVA